MLKERLVLLVMIRIMIIIIKKTVKVNADASKNLVKELKLAGVPYLALYHKGEIIFSKYGSASRDELKVIFQKNIQKYLE